MKNAWLKSLFVPAPVDPVISRPRLILSVMGLTVIVVFAMYIGWRQQAMTAGHVALPDGTVVAVDVAKTVRARERGLSGRESLEPGQGMLFLFPAKDKYGFWMKEMKFPIDIVWLEDGKVVDLMANVPVPQPTGPFEIFRPLAPVNQVLELPAGYAASKGVRVGDSLTMAVDSTDAAR